METKFGEYVISDDKSRLDLDAILDMLHRSYWAQTRTVACMEQAIAGSHCYGVYGPDGCQVGFARVLTDFATMYYMCDVIVDEQLRGTGIGKALVDAMIQSEELRGLGGVLATLDAHGLYEKYGFVSDTSGRYMRRPVEESATKG